jgi:hypothetical protein
MISRSVYAAGSGLCRLRKWQTELGLADVPNPEENPKHTAEQRTDPELGLQCCSPIRYLGILRVDLND